MWAVVLACPAQERCDVIGTCASMVRAQIGLWSVAERMQRFGEVSPHAWLDGEVVRDGVRLERDGLEVLVYVAEVCVEEVTGHEDE